MKLKGEQKGKWKLIPENDVDKKFIKILVSPNCDLGWDLSDHPEGEFGDCLIVEVD